MELRRKSIFKFLFSFILVLLLTLLPSCNLQTKKDASTFDDFANTIFNLILNGDDLSCNYLFDDVESFGLSTTSEVSLPTPSTDSLVGNLLINLYFSPLQQYDYNELNDDQQKTYLVLLDLIEYSNDTFGMSYLKSDYLGSYLGYQAQLPILLAQYHLKNKQDVENYLKYLEIMPETFKTYVDFEVLKGDNGYGMQDYVIDKVIDQCESFITEINNKGNSHFLIQTFNEKIDNVSDLTPEEIAEYKETNAELVKTDVVSAYQTVIDELPSQKGRSVNDYGLYYYNNDGDEIGKKYYEALFKKATGYEDSVDDAIVYLENKISEKYNRLKELASDASLVSEANSTILMEDTESNILNFFIDNYSTYFPELEIESMPNISILYVDESMEDHYSPASYMVSQIDNYTSEVIYLNNKSIYNETSEGKVLDYNYLYTTLAHEGFPGHMYQNIYFKNMDVNPIRKVLKNSGYMEGWATYVEYYSYNFLTEYSSELKEFLKLNDEISGLLQTRCDMGIHYEGWKEPEVEDFLGTYLKSYDRNSEKYNPNNAVKLIQQLVEIPTNSVKYYYTYLKLCDLHDWASLQEGYDEVTFHKYILECGPLPLRYVEEYVRSQYIVD